LKVSGDAGDAITAPLDRFDFVVQAFHKTICTGYLTETWPELIGQFSRRPSGQRAGTYDAESDKAAPVDK